MNTFASVQTVAELALSASTLSRDFVLDVTLARDRARALAHELSRDFVIELTLARDRVRDVTDASDRASERGNTLIRTLARARDIASSLISDPDPDRARDLDATLAGTLDIALGLARESDLDLDITPARSITLTFSFTSDADSDLVPTLDSETNVIRDPAPASEHTNARNRASDRDRDLARDLASALTRDRASARDFGPALDGNADFTRERQIFVGSLITAIGRLAEALTDMTDADLRSTDLRGIPLAGIRWSTLTRWPAAWEDGIRRDSVELGPDLGLYEIRPGGVPVDALV
jgi:hypothetical protein